MAELGASADDYRALAHFVGEDLAVDELRRWLTSRADGPGEATRREATGLVLLAAFAEHARRKSSAHNLSSCLVSLVAHRRLVREFLFTPAGLPTPEAKAAIEAAATRFGMRHAFQEDATKPFYVTVALQFGIPFGQLASELPDWRSGIREPVAIGRLLRHDVLRARDFETLWMALARAVLDPRRAHALAIASPWVPAELVETLLHAARLTSPEPRPPRAVPAAQEEDEAAQAAEVELVSPPRLNWPPAGRPRFVARLRELPLQGTFAPELRILANGEVRATLIRQRGGAYRPMGHSEFELPAVPPQRRLAVRVAGHPSTAQGLREPPRPLEDLTLNVPSAPQLARPWMMLVQPPEVTNQGAFPGEGQPSSSSKRSAHVLSRRRTRGGSASACDAFTAPSRASQQHRSLVNHTCAGQRDAATQARAQASTATSSRPTSGGAR